MLGNVRRLSRAARQLAKLLDDDDAILLRRLIEAVLDSKKVSIDDDVMTLFEAAFGDCAPWWGWADSIGFDLPSQLVNEVKISK